MRPGSLESLRGIQAALAGSIIPELSSAYAQDTAGTLQMLIESLAAEWDGLVEELSEDNRLMRELLNEALSVLKPHSEGNETITRFVNKMEEPVGGSGPSLRISVLNDENEALRGQLELLTVALEDVAPDPEYAALGDLRRAVYGHLRRVAASGWSFWDMASFRERMAALKSVISG
jgi:hypothetical protein